MRICVALLALVFVAGPAARPARMAGAPVLGVAAGRLTVDGSARFLVFISYFDGVRRARAGGIDQDLQFLAGQVDGIRVLPNWWASTCPVRAGADTLIDLDGAIRESVWRDVERLLDAAASRGLAVDLSFTRETVNDNGSPARVLSHQAYEDALARLVGGPAFLRGRFPNVLIDVQNEWPRFASAAQIERLLVRLHAADPGRLLMASVSGPAYVPTGRGIPTMIAAYHDPRGSDWFARNTIARHVQGVKSLVRQPVYLQEPMPAATVCAAQVVDRDMAHQARALDAARDAGAAAWTFHTRSTFDLAGTSLVGKLRAPGGQDERRAIEALRD
ncbi:MAG TPA: hypothetical protein VM032_16060 [Vicinamibacterales bacterium]|nr:hypothetical protein [Vicinamibacterales bacterium]